MVQYAQDCKVISEKGTELTYYTPITELLQQSLPRSEGYVVMSTPKRGENEFGQPDVRIILRDLPIVNIEVKPPSKPLRDWIQNPSIGGKEALRFSEQVHKYYTRQDLIILVTDCKTFFWIDAKNLDPDFEKPLPIFQEHQLLTDTLNIRPEAKDRLKRLINLIYLDVETAKSHILDLITNIMPDVKKLRDAFIRITDHGCQPEEKPLRKHLLEIRSDLHKSLFKNTKEDFNKQFVDLYTQLVTYGMFMGWMKFHKTTSHYAKDYTIDTVSLYLPVDSLLQNLFTGIRDHITDTLRNCLFTTLQNRFNKTQYIEVASRLGDLMNEFYSKFLYNYDPNTAKKLGVVYTDETIVNFTIRGIDHLLHTYFHKEKGILDQEVKFLDPASGTMAYPCGLIRHAFSLISSAVESDPSLLETEKYNRFNNWFRSAFLRRDEGFGNVFGFEILMAPYILGHLRVLMTAEQFGAKVDYKIDRIQSYLLNTLMDIPKQQSLEQTIALLENPKMRAEIRDALQVREKEGIMVVMGNPPYNVSSQNNSDWISKLADEYISIENLTREMGKPQIKEITGLKSMKDDYIKFIRFAQWKIAESNHQGIVAMITNNFYLDGMVARGMRKELRRQFDAIYIVNLHGETRQRLPDRARQVGVKKDEGVFDITVGTAIIFLIRQSPEDHAKHKKENPFACEVYYWEKYGPRSEKFVFLESENLTAVPFVAVPEPLDYEFTPFVVEDSKYNTYPYLCDIFLRNIQGIVTAHDTLVSNPCCSRLEQIVSNFYQNGYNQYSSHEFTGHKGERVQGRKYQDQEVKFNDSRDWMIEDGLKGNTTDAKKCIIPWQFRGFDRRYLCYYAPLLNAGTERYALMQYLLPFQNNRALIVNKLSHRSESRWSNVFITDVPSDGGCLEGASSGGASYTFPLRVNTAADADDFDHPKPALHSNLNPAFMRSLPFWTWDALSDTDKLAAGERVFYYIYGILYCPKYRELYGAILVKDFPRVPFPRSRESFEKMVNLGEKLASYHLMANPATRNVRRHPIKENALSNVEGGQISITINSYAWIEETPSIGKIWFDTNRGPDYTNPDQKRKIVLPKPSSFFIDNVPREVWTFEMGQIPQIDQWMGSRKYSAKPKKDTLSRGLSEEDLKYLLMLINAIEDTIALYPALNATYQAITSGPLLEISPPSGVEEKVEVRTTTKKRIKPLERYSSTDQK